MSGHGFEVTGDPADLPPGAKLIEINITATVNHVAEAIHEHMTRGEGTKFADLPGIQQYGLKEVALAAVHAMAELGWHSQDMHDAVREAMDDEDPKPPTGMDPR